MPLPFMNFPKSTLQKYVLRIFGKVNILKTPAEFTHDF